MRLKNPEVIHGCCAPGWMDLAMEETEAQKTEWWVEMR